MEKENKETIEVIRKGTWPIFKYVVRKSRCWRICIMIDDDIGDILISLDSNDALKHFWARDGRGEDKLRKFLVRAGTGYLKDKFSYGRNGFNLEKAKKGLDESIAEALKEGRVTEEDKEDIDSELANLMDGHNVSSDYYYATLYNCDTLMEKVFNNDYEYIPRGEDDNREAKWFVDTVWPHFVEHVKKELVDEEKENDQRDTTSQLSS